MRTTLWTAALLLGVGFSFALPALSAPKPGADVAAAAAAPAAQQPGAQAAPDNGGGAPSASPPPAPAPAASPADAAQQPPQQLAAAQPAVDLDKSIDRWRQALASESGFESWRDASWTSYPLGAGMHGYVVLLLADGREVGYMIVSAAEDGTFKLTEYGSGSHPLFSLSTLYRSAVQLELIPSSVTLGEFLNDRTSRKERLYASPMHALWKLTIGGKTAYLDAKTGEQLPADETKLPPASTDQAPASRNQAAEPAVTAKLLLPSFDPYERISWLKGKPLPLANYASVKQALAGKQRLTYVAELYDAKVTVPLAVIGYHEWSGPAEAYLTVAQDGPRYIRYASLGAYGRFFP